MIFNLSQILPLILFSDPLLRLIDFLSFFLWCWCWCCFCLTFKTKLIYISYEIEMNLLAFLDLFGLDVDVLDYFQEPNSNKFIISKPYFRCITFFVLSRLIFFIRYHCIFYFWGKSQSSFLWYCGLSSCQLFLK